MLYLLVAVICLALLLGIGVVVGVNLSADDDERYLCPGCGISRVGECPYCKGDDGAGA